METSFFLVQRLSFFDGLLVSETEYISDTKHFSGDYNARRCRGDRRAYTKPWIKRRSQTGQISILIKTLLGA